MSPAEIKRLKRSGCSIDLESGHGYRFREGSGFMKDIPSHGRTHSYIKARAFDRDVLLTQGIIDGSGLKDYVRRGALLRFLAVYGADIGRWRVVRLDSVKPQ